MSSPAEQPNPITPEQAARIRELQGLITESQRRADKAKDEDIREALNLQISKLGLKVVRLQRGQPEDLPSEIQEATDEVGEPIPKPSAEQLEAADKLIQRAHLEKRRGNKQAASDLLKQATEVAPGASQVIEALGDDYAERRQYTAAKEAYQNAHRADPVNLGIERKLARLSMAGIADLSIEDQLRLGSLDSPFMRQDESLASPKVAVMLSFMMPGVGQLVTGQTKKGLFILGLFLASSIVFILLWTSLHTSSDKFPLIAFLPAALALATWIGAIADASSKAKGRGLGGFGFAVRIIDPKDGPSRPVPPVNLPFE